MGSVKLIFVLSSIGFGMVCEDKQPNLFEMHCLSATNASLLQHAGLLHPHFVPSLVWDDIIMYLFDYIDFHPLLILMDTRS